MAKLYNMSDGSIRWYDEAPEGAVALENKKPVKTEPEEKAIEAPKNKAVTTVKTKVVKGSKK